MSQVIDWTKLHSETQALAARLAEQTKHWPHGFLHPRPGSDPAFDRVVEGADPRLDCEVCRP